MGFGSGFSFFFLFLLTLFFTVGVGCHDRGMEAWFRQIGGVCGEWWMEVSLTPLGTKFGGMQCNAIRRRCKDPPRRVPFLGKTIVCPVLLSQTSSQSPPPARLFAAVCAMVHDAWPRTRQAAAAVGGRREGMACRVGPLCSVVWFVSGRAVGRVKTVVRLFVLSAVVIVHNSARWPLCVGRLPLTIFRLSFDAMLRWDGSGSPCPRALTKTLRSLFNKITPPRGWSGWNLAPSQAPACLGTALLIFGCFGWMESSLVSVERKPLGKSLLWMVSGRWVFARSTFCSLAGGVLDESLTGFGRFSR